MAEASSTQSTTQAQQAKEALIRRITERVWQLLQADIRREQERQGRYHAPNR